MLLNMPKIKVEICERLGSDQRGVYACEDIEGGQMIEISPALVFKGKDAKEIDKTALDRFVFAWGDNGEHTAIGMGKVSLYNHSTEPNADYCQDFDEEMFYITALKPIKKGEEITFNYNGQVDDKTPQWFEEPLAV